MNKMLVRNAAALVLLTLAGLGSGYAQSTSPACKGTLIAGNYGLTVQGNKLGGEGPTGQQVGVAMTQFDGKGKCQPGSAGKAAPGNNTTRSRSIQVVGFGAGTYGKCAFEVGATKGQIAMILGGMPRGGRSGWRSGAHARNDLPGDFALAFRITD